MTVLILFLLLFLFMFIGVPIAISLGLSGALTILLFSPDSVRSLAIKLFETSEAYTLLAIPFFLLSGAFMTTSWEWNGSAWTTTSSNWAVIRCWLPG